MHQYFTPTPAEIHKISKPKFKCVGMQFVDDSDPLDSATGVVTSIVRHKKSNKLVYKYWNHHLFDVEPTDSSAFEYINVNYAVTNCKWSKYRFVVAHGANLVWQPRTLIAIVSQVQNSESGLNSETGTYPGGTN